MPTNDPTMSFSSPSEITSTPSRLPIPEGRLLSYQVM